MSGIATGTALAIGLGTSAAVGTAGSLLSGSEQAGAAESAAQLQYQEQQNALNFQEQEWNQTQANEKPWLQAGQTALGTLSGLLSTPGQGLLTPFQAPTAAQAAAYPGEQFQLQQGEQAIQRSAAAQGGLLSGGTAKSLNNYAQNVAQGDYQNVYNNAFNTFQSNQTNQFNRLAALAGYGQQTAQTLGSQGQSAASNVGNIFLTGGAQQGQDIQNAAAATASGYTGAANALSGAGSNLSQLALLQQILGSTGANATASSVWGQPLTSAFTG